MAVNFGKHNEISFNVRVIPLFSSMEATTDKTAGQSSGRSYLSGNNSITE